PLAEDVDLERLAEVTELYTGADIEAVCLEAAMVAAREDIGVEEVKMRHFEESLRAVPATLTPADIREYERLAQKVSTRTRERREVRAHLA
ncbi:MAG: AAA family ATPase, partial [Candidatus Geothermarchaeales archaeon]